MRSPGSHLCYFLLAACLALLFGIIPRAHASQNQSGNPSLYGGLWTEINPDDLPDKKSHPLLPQLLRYNAYRLDRKVLRRLLAPAPMEFTLDVRESPVMIGLPMPDGNVLRFRVVESPILGEELARQRPDIKTYAAQGIDDPWATARLDITSDGFHAMVLSPQGAVFIDPYRRGDTTRYLMYARANMLHSAQAGACMSDAALQRLPEPNHEGGRRPFVSSGSHLRTYRLAVACTGEFGAESGGTMEAAQNRITTAVNRLNAIYEQEFTIRFTLAATRIYLNGGSDPFTPGGAFDVWPQVQTELDTHVGTANYDVGHLFGSAEMPAAGLRGVVCYAPSKAYGITSSFGFVSETSLAETFAHEIGHQFDASHTFNSTAGACFGRTATTAYEPGSGSTLMAYGGRCAPENVVSGGSDLYFHGASFDQVITYRDLLGTCVSEVATGNTPPSVDAGPDYTIPRGTPFMLTANASDVNGDALTYCWEQRDLGDSTPPAQDGSRSGPLFRSLPPSMASSRTFPKLSAILANSSDPWEVLPTINRTMTFSCTVRDNRAGAGGINNDSVTITVAGEPFFVTAPNTAVSWEGNSSQTVTWNVGGGSVAANVKILLSTDGGNTFSTILESTPNDGSQAITVPNTPSTQCRVKVEAVGNIFFDISNANFTITQGTTNTAPIAGLAGAAIQLNGTAQGLTQAGLTGLNTGNTPHSIEAWVKMNALPSSRSWPLVLGNAEQGNHHWLINTDGSIQFGVWLGGQVTSGSVPVGIWTHLASTFDGATYKVYINGELAGSAAATFNLTSAALLMGISPLGESGFNGQVDEVKIWNHARTAAQIGFDKNLAQRGDESGLVAYYRFNEGVGSSATDATSNGNNGTLSNGPVWGVSGADVNAIGAQPSIGSSVTLTAYDAELNTLTYSVVNQPGKGGLTGFFPTLTYTSGPTYFGSDSFTYKANDGSLDSNTVTVNVNYGMPNVNVVGNTTGQPTYNRPDDGNPPTSLSNLGTTVPYKVYKVTVPTSGSYNIVVTRITASYDPFVTLYNGAFNPNSPLTNAVLANDDRTANINYSGFDNVTLTAGTDYFVVVSGYDNNDFGEFNLAVMGVDTPIVTESAAARAISGTVSQEECPGTAFTATFTLRSIDNADIVRTVNVTANGTYTIDNLPARNYQVKVKTANTLARVLWANTTSGNVSNLNFAPLKGGDADDSNSVDVLDLDLLIQSFDKCEGYPGYNAGADFNCDFCVDVLDLDVLIRNFDQLGEEFQDDL